MVASEIRLHEQLKNDTKPSEQRDLHSYRLMTSLDDKSVYVMLNKSNIYSKNFLRLDFLWSGNWSERTF